MTSSIDSPTADDRSELNAADPSPADLTGDLTGEAPARRQPGVLVDVDLDGYPEPVRVHVTNRDRIAYEMTAARHKEWPDPSNGRSFLMTFVTFSAAKRAGHPAATTFEQWRDAVLDWDEVAQPADPTR